MTSPIGPFSNEQVAEIAKAVIAKHDWRWALRDRRTQEGLIMACTGCQWGVGRADRGPDQWELHRAHVGAEIAAALERVSRKS